MGKTKIATIDDSAPLEEPKKAPKKLGRQDDSLVAKLREEMGIEEASKSKAERAKSDADSPLSEEGESVSDEPVSSASEKSELENQVQTNERRQKKSDESAQRSSKKRSKKYQQKVADLDKLKVYPVDEAVDIAKNLSYAGFDGTLEAHINTAQTGIRGFVSLPYAKGNSLAILAFPPQSLGGGPKAEMEKEGVVFGDDSTIEEILQGKIKCDVVIASPEWMPKLAKAAKVLGPKGLMPNPKSGTVTEDIKKAVEGYQHGKQEFKTEAKAAVIHLRLGKLSQPQEELSANVKTLISSIGKSRIKKITLSPTMGPAVKVDLASIR